MNYGLTYTKPGAVTPGFAHTTCRLFAFLTYRIGTTSAIACLSFLPFAFDGAGRGAALLFRGDIFSGFGKRFNVRA
jgi:hypothetical protein